ncbi:hypothetical protein Tco_0031837 [Tanacetum coccineum]
MENENPRCTLGDYSKPSQEGDRNTIEIPDGNNVVLLRSDTICEESWALLEDLALYDNESWNDPRDFAKPVKAIPLPQDVLSTSDRRLIELENQVQRLIEAHLVSNQPIQVNKITSSCEICSGPHDTQYCMENLEQAFVDCASSRTDEVGGLLEETEDVLGLANELSLSLGSGKKCKERILAIVNAITYCKKTKIAVGEGLTRLIFGVREIDFREENMPYWTTIEGDDDSHEKTYYSDSLNLGLEYKYDESVSKAIRDLMKMKSKVIFDKKKPESS